MVKQPEASQFLDIRPSNLKTTKIGPRCILTLLLEVEVLQAMALEDGIQDLGLDPASRKSFPTGNSKLSVLPFPTVMEADRTGFWKKQPGIWRV